MAGITITQGKIALYGSVITVVGSLAAGVNSLSDTIATKNDIQLLRNDFALLRIESTQGRNDLELYRLDYLRTVSPLTPTQKRDYDSLVKSNLRLDAEREGLIK